MSKPVPILSLLNLSIPKSLSDGQQSRNRGGQRQFQPFFAISNFPAGAASIKSNQLNSYKTVLNPSKLTIFELKTELENSHKRL
jgi:hypothetical protein